MAERVRQKPKRAALLAEKIAKDIVVNQLPRGHSLGIEPDLLVKYQISRDSFREAIRILEWQGIAQSVRGAGGGIQVSNPSLDNVSNLLREYIQLSNVSLQDILTALRIISILAVELTIKHLNNQTKETLQNLIEEYQRPPPDDLSKEALKDALLNYSQTLTDTSKLAQNPVVSIFIKPLNEVLANRTNFNQLNEQEFRKANIIGMKLHRECAQSILDEDAETATSKLEFIYDNWEILIEKSCRKNELGTNRKSHIPFWVTDIQHKKAQTLLYEIKNDIEINKLGPGDTIGREPELIKKYRISRSIFRDAIRKLEIIGLVRQRKGRNGGLIVTTPNPKGISKAAVLFLGRTDLECNQLEQARIVIEVHIAQYAATKITAQQAIALRQALETSQSLSGIDYIQAAMKIHSLISQCSGNQVLSLFMDVLAESTIIKSDDKILIKRIIENIEAIKNSLHNLITSILARDPLTAANHMRSHRALVTKIIQ